MLNPDPLVIVIGAGANNEVDLPIGRELTKSIAESLDFKIDRFNRIEGGDDQIRNCINKLAQQQNTSNGSINDYYKTALKIRDAMPLAPSIDNFIDSHRKDKRIAQIGKLAIAACILKAENKSKLYIDRTKNTKNKQDYSKLNGTWFVELFSLLSQHCDRDQLKERLSRITIVSFNYDRCFKHFLIDALLTYYNLTTQEVNDIVSNINVLHPYGSVGRMFFEKGGMGPKFGELIDSDELLRSADEIRTFTESVEGESDETNAIRESLASTKTLVYLGFAFHPLNLEVLYGKALLPKLNNECEVFATAHGISDSNCSMIAHQLKLKGGYYENRIKLHQNLKAGSLISEYSLRLARSVHSD
ncbi:hypothetical protein [Nitrosomonas sp.]|uniref:hypothetical protein n=1 Tax=Nitrosomonas sp. TaxID=42353 RepID=UPI0025ED9B18|nr:hypothetical protein [Nitrosomonas sp.]